MSTQRNVKPYPAEFREKVVRLARISGRRPREIAEEFGISADSVRRWVKQADLDTGNRKDGLSAGERKELARLRREVRRRCCCGCWWARGASTCRIPLPAPLGFPPALWAVPPIDAAAATATALAARAAHAAPGGRRADALGRAGRLAWAGPRLERNWAVFNELRDVLRLRDDELPRGGRHHPSAPRSPHACRPSPVPPGLAGTGCTSGSPRNRHRQLPCGSPCRKLSCSAVGNAKATPCAGIRQCWTPPVAWSMSWTAPTMWPSTSSPPPSRSCAAATGPGPLTLSGLSE